MHTLIAPFFNLIILIAVLAYYTRKPIADFVYGRHVFLRDEVQRVELKLRSSRERHEEFSAKLKAIDAEVAAMRAQSKQDAEAMKLRVLADARKLSANILGDAKTGVQALTDDLRQQLRSDLAAQVLSRAEVLLRERLTGDDRARIRKEFSRQVESIQ